MKETLQGVCSYREIINSGIVGFCKMWPDTESSHSNHYFLHVSFIKEHQSFYPFIVTFEHEPGTVNCDGQ